MRLFWFVVIAGVSLFLFAFLREFLKARRLPAPTGNDAGRAMWLLAREGGAGGSPPAPSPPVRTAAQHPGLNGASRAGGGDLTTGAPATRSQEGPESPEALTPPELLARALVHVEEAQRILRAAAPTPAERQAVYDEAINRVLADLSLVEEEFARLRGQARVARDANREEVVRLARVLEARLRELELRRDAKVFLSKRLRALRDEASRERVAAARGF